MIGVDRYAAVDVVEAGVVVVDVVGAGVVVEEIGDEDVRNEELDVLIEAVVDVESDEDADVDRLDDVYTGEGVVLCKGVVLGTLNVELSLGLGLGDVVADGMSGISRQSLMLL